MKKLITYFILLVFLYEFIGHYPVFLYMQNQVRNEIKQKIKSSIPREELIIFSFDTVEYGNLDWVKENKEFRYKGGLFDVVRKTFNDKGIVVLHTINDKQEKELFTQLEEQTKKNTENSTPGKQGTKLLELFSNLYMPLNKITIVPQIITLFFPSYQFSIISFIEEIPSPPPKTV